MSDRLTREEIKRDEVMEGLSRVALFLQDHGRSLLIGLAAVLVVIAGVVAWQAMAAGREARANVALGEAVRVGSEDGADPAEFASALNDVVAEFGGTKAGSVAHAYLGTLSADADDFEAARGHWQAFLDAHRDHALAAGVERNLISLDRAQGRGEELAERLQAALSSGESALSEDSVLFELGRTLEALGRIEGALEIYGRLVDEYPTSLYSSQARQRTSALEAS